MLELENDSVLHECESSEILKRVYNFFKPSVSPNITHINGHDSIEVFSEDEIEKMPLIFGDKREILPYNDKIIIHQHIKILEPRAIDVTEKAGGNKIINT